MVLDSRAYPVLLNDALKKILKKDILMNEDTIQDILKYPNANSSEFLNLLHHSKRNKSNHALALKSGVNGSEHMVWSDWEFAEITTDDGVFYLGHGIQSRDLDITDERIMHRGISKAILDGSILSVTDPKGFIMSVNHRFTEFTQFETKDLLGKRHKDILEDLHTKEFWRAMLNTIKRGKTWNEDVKIKIRSGEYRWLHTIVCPVKDPLGNIERIIHIQFDVTDYKKLLKHKEALTEIAFIQSHEFRRPVANMLGILDLLNTDPAIKKVPTNIALLIDMLRQSVRDTDEIIAKIVSKTVEENHASL
ncbi:MAG: hypothetical protein Tsb0034_26840 [Ekhidna sp.]